jgi:hypothetical protein
MLCARLAQQDPPIPNHLVFRLAGPALFAPLASILLFRVLLLPTLFVCHALQEDIVAIQRLLLL